MVRLLNWFFFVCLINIMGYSNNELYSYNPFLSGVNKMWNRKGNKKWKNSFSITFVSFSVWFCFPFCSLFHVLVAPHFCLSFHSHNDLQQNNLLPFHSFFFLSDGYNKSSQATQLKKVLFWINRQISTRYSNVHDP